MRFLIFQDSLVGGRSNNQDRVGYSYTREAMVMVVADGMGGHAQGEVAAELTLSAIIKRFQNEAKPTLANPREFMRDSMFVAHERIAEYTRRAKLPESPRTTCVACVIQGNSVSWAYAGDSRLYMFRANKLLHQTRDHSYVQRMIDAGALAPEQAQGHPARNRIYSCLGGSVLPQITLSDEVLLASGDTLLLSSDGFWEPMPVAFIEKELAQASITTALPRLISRALERATGVADNLSVIALTWSPAQDDATSTADMQDGGFHSEVRATMPEEFEHLSDISDAEIDRAIAEIRSAIHKKV